jgi:hypothetical protein
MGVFEGKQGKRLSSQEAVDEIGVGCGGGEVV